MLSNRCTIKKTFAIFTVRNVILGGEFKNHNKNYVSCTISAQIPLLLYISDVMLQSAYYNYTALLKLNEKLF